MSDIFKQTLKEYAKLSSELGKGESACVVYCRYNNDVIGSSNLKDIREYCEKYELTYLTTLDFIYYAIKNNVITIQEANEFVASVRSKDSKLPTVDFSTFKSKIIL